ncbi:MAG: hypothetical protein R6U70_01080 [Bacillota bacterium]
MILGPSGRDRKKDVIGHSCRLGLKDPVIGVEVRSGNSAAEVLRRGANLSRQQVALVSE